MSNTNGRWEFDKNGDVHYIPPDGAAPEGYSPPRSSAPRNGGSRPPKKQNNDWHWILIVLGFILWWPIGLVLLFLNLSGKWPGNQQVEKELKRTASAAKDVAKQAQTKYATAHNTPSHAAESAPKAKATEPEPQNRQKKKGKKQKDRPQDYGLGNITLFRILGWIFTGVFGFASIMTLVEELTYFIDLGYMMEQLTPLLAFTLLGVAFLGVAGSRSRKMKKYKKYLTLIGDKEEVSLSALAKTMGIREKTVYQDVEDMLEREVLPEGYLDAFRNCLVLREGGITEEPVPAPPEAPAEQPEKELDQADATLRHIRQLNDAIPNPELSEKIQQIEDITAKIFKLLKEQPEKEAELRSFLSYYLPQTVKILELYAKLEDQGIEGDNIAEAKQKIEQMMDKVVDAYEAQLDKLFANDVLDISADLKVMEAMLAKDGLTVESDFQL